MDVEVIPDKPNRAPHPDVDGVSAEEAAFILWTREGVNLTELSARTGVPVRTIYHWKKVHDWDNRRASIQADVLTLTRQGIQIKAGEQADPFLDALVTVAQEQVHKQPSATIQAVRLWAEIVGVLNANVPSTGSRHQARPSLTHQVVDDTTISLPSGTEAIDALLSSPTERDKLIASLMHQHYEAATEARNKKKTR